MLLLPFFSDEGGAAQHVGVWLFADDGGSWCRHHYKESKEVFLPYARGECVLSRPADHEMLPCKGDSEANASCSKS